MRSMVAWIFAIMFAFSFSMMAANQPLPSRHDQARIWWALILDTTGPVVRVTTARIAKLILLPVLLLEWAFGRKMEARYA